MKLLKSSIIGIILLANLGWSQSATDAVRIRSIEIGFGARNLAMGGNGIASANDYSAVYWNPAGLAGLRHSEVMGEFSHLKYSNAAAFSGTTTDADENFTRLRSLGMAVPLPTARGSMVLAFGYNFVRDFDEYLYFSGFNRASNGLEFELENPNGGYQWHKFDRNVQQTEEMTVEGGLHQFTFGTGLAVTPNFDVGVSLNFWKGKEDYRMHFYQEDTDQFYPDFPADFHSYSVRQSLITDYSAFSLKLGGMFRVNRAMKMGLAVEFPTTFKIRESYAFSDELIFDDGYSDAVEDEPGEWEYNVQTPYRFDAGISVDAGLLNLTGSATYRDWSQTRFEKPDETYFDEDYRDLLQENHFIRQDYRETINYHLGGELALPESNILLRAGYALYPSPLRDATSEMDRAFYSAGLGLKTGRNVRLDMTYVRGSRERETEDFYTPGGTLEEVTENRVLLGVRFTF